MLLTDAKFFHNVKEVLLIPRMDTKIVQLGLEIVSYTLK